VTDDVSDLMHFYISYIVLISVFCMIHCWWFYFWHWLQWHSTFWWVFVSFYSWCSPDVIQWLFFCYISFVGERNEKTDGLLFILLWLSQKLFQCLSQWLSGSIGVFSSQYSIVAIQCVSAYCVWPWLGWTEKLLSMWPFNEAAQYCERNASYSVICLDDLYK